MLRLFGWLRVGWQGLIQGHRTKGEGEWTVQIEPVYGSQGFLHRRSQILSFRRKRCLEEPGVFNYFGKPVCCYWQGTFLITAFNSLSWYQIIERLGSQTPRDRTVAKKFGYGLSVPEDFWMDFKRHLWEDYFVSLKNVFKKSSCALSKLSQPYG